MQHTITIETDDVTKFEQVKKLVQELGISFEESHQKVLTVEEQCYALSQIYWEGEETGADINAMIYGSRWSHSQEKKS